MSAEPCCTTTPRKPGHHDVTGWCERGNHGGCTSGILRAATGFHWWCACACHPEPPNAKTPEQARALATFREARRTADTTPEGDGDG